LETDDVLAIYFLSKTIKDERTTFLVGEGESFFKYIRIKSYAKSFGFSDCDFIQGFSSTHMFRYDGDDVTNAVDSLMIIPEDREVVKKRIFDVLKDSGKSPVFVISLKPFRELMEMFYSPNPGQEINNLVKHCIFAGYMSFNVRCLMKRWQKTKIVDFLKSFKTCLFYTTRNAVGGGNNNVMTERDFDFDLLPKVVRKVMELWNKHQVESSERIVKLLKESNRKADINRVKRNKKTISQVVDNNYKQFVNADTGLVMSLLFVYQPYYEKSIRYSEETGYSTVEDGDDMLVFLPDDRQQCRKDQVSAMKFLLK
jgi:hypothetical protein